MVQPVGGHDLSKSGGRVSISGCDRDSEVAGCLSGRLWRPPKRGMQGFLAANASAECRATDGGQQILASFAARTGSHWVPNGGDRDECVIANGRAYQGQARVKTSLVGRCSRGTCALPTSVLLVLPCRFVGLALVAQGGVVATRVVAKDTTE